MSHTTTIEYEHPDARLDQTGNEAEPHVDEIEVQLAFERADPAVGIMSEFWYVDDEPPKYCYECGHRYSDEEREEIGKLMDKAANDYNWDDHYDYQED